MRITSRGARCRGGLVAKLKAIEDPKTAKKILKDAGKGDAPEPDVGPAPPMPTADMSGLEYLMASFEVAQYALAVAVSKKATREMQTLPKDLAALHKQITALRGDGGESIWLTGSSEEMRARFDVAMVTASPELLAAAVAESKRRKTAKEKR